MVRMNCIETKKNKKVSLHPNLISFFSYPL